MFLIKIYLRLMVFSSLLLCFSVVHAQQWAGSPSNTGNIYRMGNVGIGTTNPTNTLTLEDNNTVGLQYNGPSSGYAGTYMNGGWPFFGYKVNGIIKGWHTMDDNGNWKLFLNNSEKLRMISTGELGLGTTIPIARLDVRGTSSSDTRGMNLNLTPVSNNSGSQLIGINTRVTNPRNGFSTTYGHYTEAYQNYDLGGYTYGAYNGAEGGIYAFGGYFKSYTELSSSTSYAIYANAIGFGTRYAGYFNGNIKVNGSVITTSDKNLKRNIEPTHHALDKVMALEVNDYEFKVEEYPHMNLPEGQHTGFIAQQLEEVLPGLVEKAVHPASNPELVKEGHEVAGEEVVFKGVDYAGVVPYLVKAIQEQQVMIEELKNELRETREQLSQLRPSEAPFINPNGKLLQNTPNPAVHSTNIAYSLKEGVSAAEIRIMDSSGKLAFRQEIAPVAKGEISVSLESFAQGTYIYSLWVDGKMIDARKMLVQASVNH